LAKYKKRKSKPTSEPDDSTKNDLPDAKKDTNISNVDEKPETEKIEKNSSKPSKSSEAIPVTTEYKKKLDKLFWIRIGLAVIAGVAATFIFEPITGEERRWASIGFMIILFIITIGIGKGMKMQLPSSDRKKLVTQGIGSYVFLYLFMWIVSYTLTNMSEESFIPSPIP
jgi:hypothetical protein